jgi:chemotaxis protein CheX
VSSTLSRSQQSSVRPDPSWKPILERAAIEVFQIMAGASLEPVHMLAEEPKGARTAMVGLAGALCGMMAIRCSRTLAGQLASLMLGGDAAENPSMIADALGELCNMVAGNFKAKISTLADHCMLSVPTVISGEDYCLQTCSPAELFQIPLTYRDELVWVSLSVHE